VAPRRSLRELTIAVIGAGRIGQAIIRAVKPCAAHIIGTGRRDETLQSVRNLGAEATRDNAYAVSRADLAIISVKPYQFPEIAAQLRSRAQGKIVVSVVAGVKLATLRGSFPGATVFRAMPNINALIAMSTTALVAPGDQELEEMLLVEELFKCLGSVYWIPEEWMDAWTALVGSGPAFIAEIVDALVLGAVMAGMPRQLAYKTLLDAIKATAEHLTQTPLHPLELRDEVTTPGGTTIYGLMLLESQGVKAGLMRVVQGSYERGRELGEKIDTAVREKLAENNASHS